MWSLGLGGFLERTGYAVGLLSVVSKCSTSKMPCEDYEEHRNGFCAGEAEEGEIPAIGSWRLTMVYAETLCACGAASADAMLEFVAPFRPF